MSDSTTVQRRIPRWFRRTLIEVEIENFRFVERIAALLLNGSGATQLAKSAPKEMTL